MTRMRAACHSACHCLTWSCELYNLYLLVEHTYYFKLSSADCVFFCLQLPVFHIWYFNGRTVLRLIVRRDSIALIVLSRKNSTLSAMMPGWCLNLNKLSSTSISVVIDERWCQCREMVGTYPTEHIALAWNFESDRGISYSQMFKTWTWTSSRNNCQWQ